MYQKILVPLDGSELAECVLPHVEAIAKEGRSLRTVIFIRVVEPFHTISTADYALSEENIKQIESGSVAATRKYLDQLVNRINLGKVKIQTEILTGKAAESIADYATESNVDLIVIATHGRSGISRWVWGSVADRILRSTCVPVFMIRAPGCVPGI